MSTHVHVCAGCGRTFDPHGQELEADRARAQANAMAQRLLPQLDLEKLARLVQLWAAPLWTSDEELACERLTGRRVLTRDDLAREAGLVLAALEAGRAD